MIGAAPGRYEEHILGIKNEHKKEILAFMKSFEPSAIACGYVLDYATGEEVDGIVGRLFKHEGLVWSEDAIYNFDRNDLELNPEFCERVLSLIGSEG